VKNDLVLVWALLMRKPTTGCRCVSLQINTRDWWKQPNQLVRTRICTCASARRHFLYQIMLTQIDANAARFFLKNI